MNITKYTILAMLILGIGYFFVDAMRAKVLLHSWITILGLITIDQFLRKRKGKG